jgi:hypothetical protein
MSICDDIHTRYWVCANGNQRYKSNRSTMTQIFRQPLDLTNKVAKNDLKASVIIKLWRRLGRVVAWMEQDVELTMRNTCWRVDVRVNDCRLN